MGFLRRLLRRPTPRQEEGLADPTDPQLLALLEEEYLIAMHRQEAFALLVGDPDWQFDQDDGFLRLGSGHAPAAQILGSVAFGSGTWRWAWANESIDSTLQVDALRARDMGQERDLGFMATPDLPLEVIGSGHWVALAVTRLLGAHGYFRGPHPGGEIYFTLRFPDGPPSLPGPVGLDASLLLQKALPSSPVWLTRGGVRRYLAWLGLTVTDEPRRLVAVAGRERLEIGFDELGRITEIGGEVGEG